MACRRFRLTMAFAVALIVVAPALAAEKRHQFLEPIRPDRQRQEKVDEPASAGKICYCRVVHERNVAGRLTWKLVCSEEKPRDGARKIRADDCRAIRDLPPQ